MGKDLGINLWDFQGLVEESAYAAYKYVFFGLSIGGYLLHLMVCISIYEEVCTGSCEGRVTVLSVCFYRKNKTGFKLEINLAMTKNSVMLTITDLNQQLNRKQE